MGNDEPLRIGTLRDLAGVIDLGKAAGLEGGEHELVDIRAGWEARCGEDLVGCVLLRREAGLDLVSWLAVRAERRHRGIGGALLAALEEKAAGDGVRRLWATARAPAFFLKRGYEDLSEDLSARRLLASCTACPHYGSECTPKAVGKDLLVHDGVRDGDGVLAREPGRAGELVLRRRRGHLEVISNGAFLISSQNEVSSRALVSAAALRLPYRELHGFIAGLGLGYALDEALRLPRLASLVVAELEPAVVEWFRRYGGERARRAEADGRVRVLIGDALDVLSASTSRFDLICMDTDNGPAWLVRESNAVFYSQEGVRLICAALRPGGVAVFWSPGPSSALVRLLDREIGAVEAVPAVDVVDGRRFEYLMYVAERET